MANFSHLCMNCLNPLPQEDLPLCPHCGDKPGEPNPPQFLQAGTTLSERYLVGRLQQAGGDTAQYAGYDTVLKAPVVIREFWPSTLCERSEDDQVRVISGCEQTYLEYLNKFLTTARVVARLRDLPASIPIYDIFQQNGTAYTVSERYDGPTLSAYLEEQGGRLSWDEARPLFVPLMTSLIAWHKAGIHHFGFSPDVLILAEDGKLHIGDFSIPEARCSDSELTPDLKSGYAAPEQYTMGVAPSAATDVYGLAAVIFRTLVGSPPPDGETRPQTNSDLTVPADVASTLPPHVAAALFSALQPSTEKRLATMDALRDRLAAAPAVAALLDDDTTEDRESVLIEDGEEEFELEPPKSHRGLYAALLVVGFILLLALLAGALLALLFPGRFGGEGQGATGATTTVTTGSIFITDTTSSQKPNTMAKVPNLIGQDYDQLRGKYVEDRAVMLEGLKYSDTVPAGIVMEQSPSSDKEADITEPVYVIISAGSEYVEIPDVAGWDLAHAMAYMQALGFEVQVDQVAVSAQEAGKIDSTSPSKGNTLARGGVIRLRVSAKTTVLTTTTTSGNTTGATTTTTTAAIPTTTTTTTAAIPTTTTTTTTTMAATTTVAVTEE